MKKRTKTYVIASICAVFVGVVISIKLLFFSVTIDAEEFLQEGNYTKEELLLFSDIAFPYNRIRKWDEDIKVEIVKAKNLTQRAVKEVDSIISILSPLVTPRKMYRVEDGGNLLVYRLVDSIPISMSARGLCDIPSLIARRTWSINSAKVYDIWYISDPNICLHEFEHALGLQHPSKQPSAYMQICGEFEFSSIDCQNYVNSNTLFYLSDEEKKIIKMLYSPHIKSGLTRKEFMKKMGLNLK